MNKKIKMLLSNGGMLQINNFCVLKCFYDDYGKNHLILDFTCCYGKATHSVLINSRDSNTIKEIIEREQSYFFNELRDMLNKQVKNGYLE